jgi:hypothetical protein
MSLELMRKKLELTKVKASKEEMEFNILLKMEDVKRLEENIVKQNERIMELETLLTNGVE